jgi:hypothetical protein
MTEEAALYIRDGDAFVGTVCTKGAWAHGGQAGGAVLALLGDVLADVSTLTPMSMTRLPSTSCGLCRWVSASTWRPTSSERARRSSASTSRSAPATW